MTKKLEVNDIELIDLLARLEIARPRACTTHHRVYEIPIEDVALVKKHLRILARLTTNSHYHEAPPPPPPEERVFIKQIMDAQNKVGRGDIEL